MMTEVEPLDEIGVRLAGISDPIRLLQGIFAYAPFGLQVYRADGHCLLTNKAFRDMFGSEPPPDYNVQQDDIAERQGLLEQILTNLLSNAVKYGAGHPISVEVGATAGAGDAGEVWLTVRDRGIGMSADELGRIFGRFERGVSERNYGGLGLGLWIVRQILDAMSGSIAVESVPGGGATFTVRFPRNPPPPA